MTKGSDWVFVTVMVISMSMLAWSAASWVTAKPKPAPVTVTCVGDYKVFVRGDQFDVLFSEECERLNVKPRTLKG